MPHPLYRGWARKTNKTRKLTSTEGEEELAFLSFVLFSKKQHLVMLIFSTISFLVSISFISALIFMIYFLLLILSFVFLSLVALCITLGGLFEGFLVS